MKDLWTLILALIIVLGIFFGIRFFVIRKAKKLIGREFKGLKEGIVYFYSPRCRACKQMEPTIEEISKEIKVYRINVNTEEGEKLAKEFGILGTPTILVVKEGRIQDVIIGTRDYEELKSVISK
ncbi:thioredoxin family protein [Aquifex sp.]